ncbi:30S ribosome-binding factor RbfA [Saccharobesus litoralis]|uniref:Ribosome-binding factor A n=1 Tax=Saccharobesus litoralis TaxID=2172099 RepID=A0A2S0VS97_9ALTE|nr:30S ribosome-binding factor RbfA [Saccharobesus litoralis]AWB67084.1 30S ribosome-binding factor RbfA [Saccharobesus litoralis]
MKRNFSRPDRVAQQILKEVALILQREIKDPRLGMITVADVEVSRDLGHAKVFVSSFEQDADKQKEVVAALKESEPYVRSLLAKVMRMRSVPEIHFHLDTSLIDGIRMSNLVDQALAKDKALANQHGTTSDVDEDDEQGNNQ